MDCREAQALIVPFIEGTLNDEQNQAFIEHVEHCSECYDELEVYYIVIVGIKQLEEDQHMVVDFSGNLQAYIASKKEVLARKHYRGVHIRTAILTVTLALIVFAGFISYNIYNRPDTAARYYTMVMTKVNPEIKTPPAEKKTFIISTAENYFLQSRFDMPLRRIKTSAVQPGHTLINIIDDIYGKELNHEQGSID